jgi:glycosyltransferase involved in cell wall biosynthesis
MKNNALVTVGIPTYNRVIGLERTLQSIKSQTYSNLEIVVSDNASPDKRVRKVIEQAASMDARIRHFTQKENIGAADNFLFVLRQAKGDFFMWAADDDEWHPSFIEELLTPLLRSPLYGLSFCDFHVLFSDGSPCKDYGSFTEAFNEFADRKATERVFHYALQDPKRGKANIIYGLYRMEALDPTRAKHYFHSKAWGTDMLFVCDILSRWGFHLTQKKLYSVGISRPQDAPALPEAEDKAKNSRRLARLKLAAGYLHHGISCIEILAKTNGSNPLTMLRFVADLIPRIWILAKTV